MHSTDGFHLLTEVKFGPTSIYDCHEGESLLMFWFKDQGHSHSPD